MIHRFGGCVPSPHPNGEAKVRRGSHSPVACRLPANPFSQNGRDDQAIAVFRNPGSVVNFSRSNSPAAGVDWS